MAITLSGSGNPLNVDGNSVSLYPTLMTSKSASGTFVDFTGIPSWARKITIMFRRVSVNTSGYSIGIQLGTSGGFVTSSYTSTTFYYSGGGNSFGSTNGIGLLFNVSSSSAISGIVHLNALDSNLWVCTSQMNSSGFLYRSVGDAPSLASPLTRIRILSLNLTTLAFDAGTINVMYE